MRRYVVMGLALVILLLVALIIMPRPQGVDILIALKGLNQEVAPAAISCPDWSYPQGTIVRCTVEGVSQFAEVDVLITKDGVEFADSRAAKVAINSVID